MEQEFNNLEYYQKFDIQIPKELAHMVPAFLERRETEIHTIETHLEKAEFSVIKNIAHKMKGHGATYGFTGLSALGKDLEIAAGHQNETVVKELVKMLPTMISTYRKICCK